MESNIPLKVEVLHQEPFTLIFQYQEDHKSLHKFYHDLKASLRTQKMALEALQKSQAFEGPRGEAKLLALQKSMAFTHQILELAVSSLEKIP